MNHTTMFLKYPKTPSKNALGIVCMGLNNILLIHFRNVLINQVYLDTSTVLICK